MQTAQRKIHHNIRTAPPKKRIVKMDGNVAYINNGFAKKKVKQPALASKKNAKQKKPAVASTLFVLFIAFCALAALISRYAAISSIGADNNEIANNIKIIEAKIEELEIDIELCDNLEYVQKYARQELGMKYPGQDQKIYIDMGS